MATGKSLEMRKIQPHPGRRRIRKGAPKPGPGRARIRTVKHNSPARIAMERTKLHPYTGLPLDRGRSERWEWNATKVPAPTLKGRNKARRKMRRATRQAAR